MQFNWVEVSKGCANGLYLALNGLSLINALITLGFAAVDTRILAQYGEDRAAGTFAGDMVIIAVSLMVVAITVYGCVGAVRENTKILYLYVGFVSMMMVVEMMTVIFVGVQRRSLEIQVVDWLRDDFFKNGTYEERAERDKVWDGLQSDYECCGLNGPEDYLVLRRSISTACCQNAYRARTVHAQKLLYQACVETAGYYTRGCEDEILRSLRDDAEWLVGVAIIAFWFQAAGMVLAMWIAKGLKNPAQLFQRTLKP